MAGRRDTQNLAFGKVEKGSSALDLYGIRQVLLAGVLGNISFGKNDKGSSSLESYRFLAMHLQDFIHSLRA